MDKEEVEKVLESAYWVKLPEHLVYLDKPLVGCSDNKCALLGGLYSEEKNVIVLSPIFNREVLFHEMIHKNLKVGERLAYPLGKLLALKNKVFPGPLRRNRKVHYEYKGEYTTEELKEMGIFDFPSAKGGAKLFRLSD